VLSERVAELTRRLLPTGQCSAEAIAAELALHPRTLQRRLAIEGVRCQDVIDRERRAQPERYLAEPRLHLSQIAACSAIQNKAHSTGHAGAGSERHRASSERAQQASRSRVPHSRVDNRAHVFEGR
jgi:hypothetical protein